MAKRKKEVPTGVKVISVLGYILAALSLIGGIMLLAGAGMMSGFSGMLGLGVFGAMGAGIFIAAGILSIALAVLYFFVSKDLWLGKNWARVAVIVLSAIGVIFALINLIMGNISSLITIAIHALVGSYMIWSKEVLNAFK